MTTMHRVARLIFSLAIAAAVPACGATVTPTDGAPDNTTTDGGSVDATTTDAVSDMGTQEDRVTPTDTLRRVPMNHRAVADACPTTRAAGACPYPDAGTLTGCSTDSQCTMGTNGRCIQEVRVAACSCSYDQCASDSECTGGAVCACRVNSRGARGANVCLAANCRTDSDCGAQGFCSPTLDFGCGAYTGLTGYYCHTPQDECIDDGDCAGRDAGPFGGGMPFCGYSPMVGHWACASVQCAG